MEVGGGKVTWRDIPGRLTDAEGQELQRLAVGRVVLEIGSLLGRSTVCLAEVARAVHAIDPHRPGNTDFHSDFAGKDSLIELRANLRAEKLDNRVLLHVGTVGDLWLPSKPVFDLAFVDGCHLYPAVRKDLAFVQQIVKPGGKIVVHDYGINKRGVTSAVDEFVARSGVVVRCVESLAIWIVSGPEP